MVGHIPYSVQIQMRNVNKGFAEVTGEELNRGAGYGQEVPCVFRLYGPKDK